MPGAGRGGAVVVLGGASARGWSSSQGPCSVSFCLYHRLEEAIAHRVSTRGVCGQKIIYYIIHTLVFEYIRILRAQVTSWVRSMCSVAASTLGENSPGTPPPVPCGISKTAVFKVSRCTFNMV